MKKSIYTIAFVAAVALAGNAQTGKTTKDDNVKPVPATTNTDAKEQPKQDDKGTRMAISEKGLPAPKAKAAKDAKDDKNTGNK
jgi:hypothetical protein